MSGSLNKTNGGHTFGKNGVIRRRVIPTNPNTPSQSETRAFFSVLTAAWSGTLTAAERSAWEAARSSGNYQKTDSVMGVQRPYKSGKDLFLGMNYNIAQANGTLDAPAVAISTPGVIAALDNIGDVAVAIDASAQTVALTFTGSWATEAGVFSATAPVSPGNMKKTSVASKFRVIDAPIDGSSPTALGPQYVAVHGALTGATGLKVFWKLEGVELGTGKKRLIASGDVIVMA